MTRILSAAFVAAVAFGTSASAHHSYSAYDVTRIVEIEGTLEELVWVSPHSLFKVRSDERRLYVGEWRAPIAMQRMGMNGDTLQKGDRIILAGNPKRDFDETGILNLKSVRRLSDGGKWPPS
jgi:Family of unknown function (DUF6152)